MSIDKRTFIILLFILAAVSGGILMWKFNLTPEISKFLAYDPGGSVRTNISITKFYSDACEHVVSPTDDYVGVIANSIPTNDIQLICFRPGTYNREIVIEDKRNLIIIAPEKGAAIQANTPTTSTPSAIMTVRNSSNIYISGFEVINLYAYSGATQETQNSNGILVRNSSNVIISNTAVNTRGKNAVILNDSTNIQLLNISIKCRYFCAVASGGNWYFKDSYIETNAGEIEDHTMFWSTAANWLMEDTVLNQVTGIGFISTQGNDSDVNRIVLRGATQSTGLSSWIARHHNFRASNVYLEGQFPSEIVDFITYDCNPATHQCENYPESIAYRYHVYKNPSANKPTTGAIGHINDAEIAGWATDPDIPAQNIGVQIYFDGPPGVGTLHNAPTDASHEFFFQVPNQYKDCKPHTVYAYAIGDAEPYTQIRQSPGIYFTCPSSMVTLNANPSTITQGQSSSLTWTALDASTCTGVGILEQGTGEWTGSKSLSGSQVVQPGGTGVYTYLLRCMSLDGHSTDSHTTVTVRLPSPTPTPPLQPADINRDGKVDIFDYNTLVEKFGQTSNIGTADIIPNGMVDIFDYNALVNDFGKRQ